MTLQLDYYFLSPVEVVKVTSNNLQEVAEWCGGKVAQTESRRVPGRMDSYVWVPTPKNNSGISWAFPGMFITKRLVITMKGEFVTTWAVFRRDYFDKNYFNTPEDAVNKTWEVDHANRQQVAKTNKQLAAGDEVKNVTFIQAGTGASVEMSLEDAKNAGLVIDFSNAVKTEVTAQIKEPSATAVEIAQTVGQTPEFVQAVLDAPVEDVAVLLDTVPKEDLIRSAELVREKLGGVEIESPDKIQLPRQAEVHEEVLEEKSGGGPVPTVPPKKEEVVEAYVHNHTTEIACDLYKCTVPQVVEGIHVFDDKTISINPATAAVQEIETPVAIAELKA